jgi:hypothetical protein
MGILTGEMRRAVETQLGFVATTCPDGTPNLSPKGTTAVWDDDHLVFAHIHSPGTVANLRSNPEHRDQRRRPAHPQGLPLQGDGSGAHRRRRLRTRRSLLRSPGDADGASAHQSDRDRRRRARPPGHLPGVRPGRHRGRVASAVVFTIDGAPGLTRRTYRSASPTGVHDAGQPATSDALAHAVPASCRHGRRAEPVVVRPGRGRPRPQVRRCTPVEPSAQSSLTRR